VMVRFASAFAARPMEKFRNSDQFDCDRNRAFIRS
jgi:hypothetical protein